MICVFLGAGTGEACYWGSGERVGVPWWCGGQPDDDFNEPVLWLQSRRGDFCFHDGGQEPARNFICEQGEIHTYKRQCVNCLPYVMGMA